MTRFHHRRASLAAAALLSGLPGATAAEAPADEADGIDTSFSLGVVSDYRYRGLSLSDKKPALQAEVSVSHDTGIYGRLWGSTIADNGGAGVEAQLSLGYYVEFGAFNADVQTAYYLYPGAPADNYAEVAARLGRKLRTAEIGAMISYAPAQQGTGDLDNLYIGLDGSLPLIGDDLALTGSFGREDGAFGDQKLDWSLGLSGEMAGLSLGLMYIDTHRSFGDPLGKPTIVASVGATF